MAPICCVGILWGVLTKSCNLFALVKCFPLSYGLKHLRKLLSYCGGFSLETKTAWGGFLIITDRVRSTRGGNVFSLSVSPHLGGGGGVTYLPDGGGGGGYLLSGLDGGEGYLPSQVQGGGGTYSQVWMVGGGVPTFPGAGGGVPTQDWMGGGTYLGRYPSPHLG